MTADSDDLPVARLGSPGELALIVPDLLGFVPAESLTVLSLREPRGRVGLAQRIDLPPVGRELPRQVVQGLVDRVCADRGTRLAAVLWTQCSGDTPLVYEELVAALVLEAGNAGLDVTEVLLVRDDRWWSYLCHDDVCCPWDGHPLEESLGAPSVSMVAAERALAGRAVLRSRQELADSIAPVLPLGRAFAVAALAAAANRLAEQRQRDPTAQREQVLARWRWAIVETADPRFRLDDDVANELVVSLLDGGTRDDVLFQALQSAEPLQRLLEELCRRSVPPFDADLCTLLGWAAYLQGGGALASIAIERALADDPWQSGAGTLAACLDAGVSPDELRAIVVAGRDQLASPSRRVHGAGRRRGRSGQRRRRRRI